MPPYSKKGELNLYHDITFHSKYMSKTRFPNSVLSLSFAKYCLITKQKRKKKKKKSFLCLFSLTQLHSTTNWHMFAVVKRPFHTKQGYKL